MTITRNEHLAGDQALRVTSVRDGHEHLVAQEAMLPGSEGRCPALCGHRVWVWPRCRARVAKAVPVPAAASGDIGAREMRHGR